MKECQYNYLVFLKTYNFMLIVIDACCYFENEYYFIKNLIQLIDIRSIVNKIYNSKIQISLMATDSNADHDSRGERSPRAQE